MVMVSYSYCSIRAYRVDLIMYARREVTAGARGAAEVAVSKIAQAQRRREGKGSEARIFFSFEIFMIPLSAFPLFSVPAMSDQSRADRRCIAGLLGVVEEGDKPRDRGKCLIQFAATPLTLGDRSEGPSDGTRPSRSDYYSHSL